MKPAIVAAIGGALLGLGFVPAAPVVRAQATPLPPVTHTRETRMSIRAKQLQQKLTDQIAQAKAKGVDATEAEKHKSQGDSALSAGHLRIAVHEYEAGEKALSGK